MSAVRQFLGRLEEFRGREAMVWRNKSFSFDNLIAGKDACCREFLSAGGQTGGVVSVEGDFSPSSVAALLACMELGLIAVPLTASVESKKAEFCETAEVEFRLCVDKDDGCSLVTTGRHASHELLFHLRCQKRPGLVLFSSGSTGYSKAIVHDAEGLLKKYLVPRHCYRTLGFLLFDHIGGIDTLLYNLANGSCLVTVPNLSPETVCAAVAAHRVEVLPVSPTFINLLLLDRVHERHDLSSLQIITYGAEVMPESTLARLHEAFPTVRLLQKFGATEIGTMRSQSRSSNSVWLKIGGEGYLTRVVDGFLEIKAESAMLGYLNASNPFTEDGWFKTGDAVAVDGEWMRILGRKSEVINVGGEKVYPAEVEGVLQEMTGVEEVAVTSEANAITGNIIVAKVKLLKQETAREFRKRMWEFCRERLPAYKIPQKVILTEHMLTGTRQKKVRR